MLWGLPFPTRVYSSFFFITLTYSCILGIQRINGKSFVSSSFLGVGKGRRFVDLPTAFAGLCLTVQVTGRRTPGQAERSGLRNPHGPNI